MKRINITKRECVERAAPAASLSHLSHEDQVATVNRLFMGEDCTDCKALARELEKKRYGYYQQDLRKKRVATIEEVLTLNELEEKIVASKLRCFYCASAVLLSCFIEGLGKQFWQEQSRGSKRRKASCRAQSDCALACVSFPLGSRS